MFKKDQPTSHKSEEEIRKSSAALTEKKVATGPEQRSENDSLNLEDIRTAGL